jgi:hypothetical protein
MPPQFRSEQTCFYFHNYPHLLLLLFNSVSVFNTVESRYCDVRIGQQVQSSV